MQKENSYMDKLLSNDKYLTELDRMYNDLCSLRRFKRRIEEIEKEIVWFVGNKKNYFVPDYNSFYNYALEHYISMDNKNVAYPQYLAWIDGHSAKDIPGVIYCIALFGHLGIKEKEFLQVHESDIDSLTEKDILEYTLLHNKLKLLCGFLNKMEPLVAAFVNTIDASVVEHLADDTEDLDALAIKHRFMLALHNRDKSTCYKLLGRMRELDEGEDYYFEALAHYINEDYKESIRYIEKIKRGNIDYRTAIALKLECYSYLGDMAGFFNCMAENRDIVFDRYHAIYFLMSLILRRDISNDDSCMPFTDTWIEEVKFDDKDTFFLGCIFRLTADILVEEFNLLDGIDVFPVNIETLDISPKKMERLAVLSLAISLCPTDIGKYLDYDYIRNKECSLVREDAKSDILKLLINYESDDSFENIKKAFLTQLKLGFAQEFLDNVSKNAEVLMEYADNGVEGAEELLRVAYIEGIVSEKLDAKVKARVEAAGDEKIVSDIEDKKIISFLSPKGKNAYIAAEWIYRKSIEEDYGWKDAGMISLGFFRIIELELNQKIIIPVLSSVGYSVLNTEYNTIYNALSDTDRKSFKAKWRRILDSYKDMENNGFAGKGFMLGELYKFFKAVGSDFVTSDQLATLIKNSMNSVLNSNGVTKLEEGFFEEITNDDMRNKYRNPPAHTEYMPYETACECREVFRKTTLQLRDLLINVIN